VTERVQSALELPIVARAPGKAVVFGEHAIVHGCPAVVMALDRFTHVRIERSDQPRLNGHAEDVARNPYLTAALARYAGPALNVSVRSDLPRAAGLGSSAAFCAALTADLAAFVGGSSPAELAQSSFATERGAQGVGSPGDTSAAVAGGFISVNGGDGPVLWNATDGERSWTVHRLADPGWSWLVAYSGVPRNTAQAVRAVGRRLKETDGPRLLERFTEAALQGLAGIERKDRAAVGRSLTANQELLREVGVSHPRLEALLEAVAPMAEGMKLTGAGVGGSILALPKPGRELEASRKIAGAGGVPYTVHAARQGAEVVRSMPDE